MKRAELKSLIKECVKEVLFEDGVLSSVIAEVAFGITKAQNMLTESAPAQPIPKPSGPSQEEIADRKETERRRLLETKRKMLDAIGSDSMKGIFEGTEPLSSPGTPGSTQAQGPMAGIDPRDSGVDISRLFSLAGQKWQQLK